MYSTYFLPNFLKCLQIFSCHALCLTPAERSHLTSHQGMASTHIVLSNIHKIVLITLVSVPLTWWCPA